MDVKICGLTNLDDALFAAEAGADLLGFLFAEVSPRHIAPEKVKEIIQGLPGSVKTVGLFKDHSIEKVLNDIINCGLDCVQLHGNESPDFCAELKVLAGKENKEIEILKTFKVKDRIMGLQPDAYKDVDYFLFDTYHPKMMGGTGIKFDWDVLKGFKGDKPFFLAGGLNPGNVKEAVATINPFGVDIASGVEREVGSKDHDKVKEFILNAKNA